MPVRPRKPVPVLLASLLLAQGLALREQPVLVLEQQGLQAQKRLVSQEPELLALPMFLLLALAPAKALALPLASLLLEWQVPALAISSTDCRDRVAAGDPVWYLVPDGVVQYISKRELYR